MASRRKAREFALQLLFQQDLAGSTADEICSLFWELNETDLKTRRFSERLFTGFVEHQDRINDLIRQHARNWRLERMASVDRNLLRMAVSEFLFAETPWVVVIDEAIEMARKYGGSDSTEFVNGVLDSIRKELET